MKLNNLLLKTHPLVINGETVEDTFIKESSVSQLFKLSSIGKEKNKQKQLEMAMDLVKVSLVNSENEFVLSDKDELSSEYVMEICNEVMKVNTPKEGK